MSIPTLGGIYPALVTPFDADGSFAPAAFDQLLARVHSAAIRGVYVCGSTGEGMLQSVAQRKLVTAAAVAASPRDRQVIVHVGAHRTSDAVELARHAASVGATAVSSLPPGGAYSFAEVKTYYERLATATDLPFLLYFFPGFSAAIQTAQQIEELCAIPNVVGLKYTDHDLYRLSLLSQPGRVVFNGYDEVLAAGLFMGASGGIGTFYNLIPDLFVAVHQAATAGDWQAARATQHRINELISLTLRFPCFPAVKAILRWQGIACGECLEPRRALTPTELDSLREALRKSSFAYLAGS